jgi:hypothetical protein
VTVMCQPRYCRVAARMGCITRPLQRFNVKVAWTPIKYALPAE